VKTCLHCNFANPEDFRYCGNCGRLLKEEYPKIPPFVSSPSYHPSQTLPPDVYEQFQAAARQARGERRDVAVLFADLVGYTSLSARLDPEEVFSLINRYLGVLIEQVYKYGGVIDKFTGDGIMALFGAPVTHEDDAERAVRAAIEMCGALDRLGAEIRTEMGVDIQVRLGAHYGAVILGEVGVYLNEAVSVIDYTAIGDTVNLASRLEHAAEPNSALVSQEIYERTKERIQYASLPPLILKGFGEPILAYRAIGLGAGPLKTPGGDTDGA
jgi:adenylate cyclase